MPGQRGQHGGTSAAACRRLARLTWATSRSRDLALRRKMSHAESRVRAARRRTGKAVDDVCHNRSVRRLCLWPLVQDRP